MKKNALYQGILILLTFALLVLSGCGGGEPAEDLKGHIEALTEIATDNKEDPAAGVEALEDYVNSNLPDMMEDLGEMIVAIDEAEGAEAKAELFKKYQEDLSPSIAALGAAMQGFGEAVNGNEEAQEKLKAIMARFEALKSIQNEVM